jgi:hypothetical protein
MRCFRFGLPERLGAVGTHPRGSGSLALPGVGSLTPQFFKADAQRPIYPREVHQGAHGRQKAGCGIFPTLPEGTVPVESWRHLQSENIEFTMKRLREPIEGAS